MADTVDRVRPHDIEAEQAVLGSILMDQKQLDSVAEMLHPHDFMRPAHTRIYEAMLDMRSHGREVDAITVRDKLEADGLLDECGGAPYLLDLNGACSSAFMAKSYAKIVKRTSTLRKVIDFGSLTMAAGYDAPDDADALVSDIVAMALTLSEDQVGRERSIAEIGQSLYEKLKAGPQPYIAPPLIPWLHIKPGSVVVLAAGTSVGKTATSMEWADEWSKSTRVSYFEYEMDEEGLFARLVAKYSGISMERMDEGLSSDELERVEWAINHVRSRNLAIEAVYCNATTLMAKIRKAAHRGSKVVVVDHLGLVPFNVPRGESYAKALGSQVTNKLKRMALELGIVIVLLVQLNREGQKRSGTNPFPKLWDLRDSGEIEQDADIVVGIWGEGSRMDDPVAFLEKRESIGLDTDDTSFRLMHYGVIKNRNGRLGGEYGKFYGARMELMPIVAQLFSSETVPQVPTSDLQKLLVDELGATIVDTG